MKINEILLSAEEAGLVWRYEPETGIFFWLTKPRHKRQIGDAAGYKVNCGYWILRLGGRYYLAHRVAWLLTTGKWPKNEIDHIDGNRSNNQIKNLREATHSQNMANRKVSARSKTGIKGVHPNGDGYAACIRINNKSIHLGYFNNLEDGKAAYDLAAKRVHGEFARI